jgi:hypothetical protein
MMSTLILGCIAMWAMLSILAYVSIDDMIAVGLISLAAAAFSVFLFFDQRARFEAELSEAQSTDRSEA